MGLTMTSLLFILLLISPATRARYSYMSGRAIETKTGVIPMDGVSPVPTEAPGSNGIAKELRKRDSPQSVCGLIDGDPQNTLTCGPSIPCLVTRNLYIACCTINNPDICFGDPLPTICFDYDSRLPNPSVGSLTFLCNAATPYCNSITSYGSIPQFFCAFTSYPRSHSFVPIAAYYSSFTATSLPILPSTVPAKPTATTAIIYDSSNGGPKKKSGLRKGAKAGIGSGVGVVTLAVISFLGFCFRRRRQNRANVAPTAAGGAANPIMAQTKNTPQISQGAAPPVQQQYQQQPQGYQVAAPPVQQQYQPQPQGYQGQGAAPPVQQQYQPQPQVYQGTALPVQQQYQPQPQPQPQGYQNATQQSQPPQLENTDPISTSGSQHISRAPIPTKEPTSEAAEIASTYSSSADAPHYPTL